MSSISDLPPPETALSSSGGIDDLPPPSQANGTPGFWALASKINGGSNPLNEPADAMLADPEGTKTQAKIGTAMALGGMVAPAVEGAGFLARTGANAAVGGATKYAANKIDDKENGFEGVPGAALTGGAVSAGADALGGIYGGVKQMIQTGKWAADPTEMQNAASAAIEDATSKLKASEAENLKNALAGKSVAINTTEIKGIHPDIDAILANHADSYGTIPSNVTMSAEDANDIRRTLDSQLSYKKLGPFAQTAEVAERDQQLKGLADGIRGQIHDVSPEVSDTLDQWSDNLGQARNLDKRAETAPVTVLTSPSIDRRALLQKVDNQVGTNLVATGSQMNDAKNLGNAVHQLQPVKAIGALGMSGAKGALPAVAAGGSLSNPSVIQGAVAATSPQSWQTNQPQQNQVSPNMIGKGSAPATGPDKWAQDGLKNLGINDAGFSQRLLADPKATNLLHQASDLKPGSAALKQVMNQIQKGWGQG